MVGALLDGFPLRSVQSPERLPSRASERTLVAFLTAGTIAGSLTPHGWQTDKGTGHLQDLTQLPPRAALPMFTTGKPHLRRAFNPIGDAQNKQLAA